MAQLRQTYHQFETRDTVVIVVGPDGPEQFAEYFSEHDLPFVGLPDPKHRVLKTYGQEVNLFKLGRMPAQVLVDKSGMVRFVHYSKSMRDIPEPESILEQIDRLNTKEVTGPGHEAVAS